MAVHFGGCALVGDLHVELHPERGVESQAWMEYETCGNWDPRFPAIPEPAVIGNGRHIAATVRDQLPDRRIGWRIPEGLESKGLITEPDRVQGMPNWVVLDEGAAEAFEEDLARALAARGYTPVAASTLEPDSDALRLAVDLRRIWYQKGYGHGSNVLRIDIDVSVYASHRTTTLQRDFTAHCVGDIGFFDVVGGTMTEDRVQYAMNAAAWELTRKILDDPDLIAFFD